ncbi:MAG: hypothetical protein AAFQ02_07520, partial [Bacteroidota bacterium]
SLFLGTLCSVLVIKMMSLSSSGQQDWISPSTAIVLAVGLMIVPAFDTIRVFLIRIMNGLSPFEPDQRHIHHLLLRAGFTHLQSTVILVVVNVACLLIVQTSIGIHPTVVLTLLLLLMASLTLILEIYIQAVESRTLRTDP